MSINEKKQVTCRRIIVEIVEQFDGFGFDAESNSNDKL